MPEQQSLCLAHKLMHSNRVKQWWILNKTFRISKTFLEDKDGDVTLCIVVWCTQNMLG